MKRPMLSVLGTALLVLLASASGDILWGTDQEQPTSASVVVITVTASQGANATTSVSQPPPAMSTITIMPTESASGAATSLAPATAGGCGCNQFFKRTPTRGFEVLKRYGQADAQNLKYGLVYVRRDPADGVREVASEKLMVAADTPSPCVIGKAILDRISDSNDRIALLHQVHEATKQQDAQSREQPSSQAQQAHQQQQNQAMQLPQNLAPQPMVPSQSQSVVVVTVTATAIGTGSSSGPY